jgi:hypothetical protein
MHYFVRIGGMIIGVVAGSALLAYAVNWMMTHYGISTSLNGVSVFVGLLVAGLVGAVLARDSWFFA